MKREPTLADHFLMAGDLTHWGLSPVWRSMQRKTRIAEKFVFDTAASARVAEVLYAVPELLIEQIQFARPPFDLCWIEYDVDTIFGILNPQRKNLNPTRDKRVGLLVDHNHLYVVAQSFDGKIGLVPFTYWLNTEWPAEEQFAFCGKMFMTRDEIDLWLWGAAAPILIKKGKQDYLRVLRETNKAELISIEGLSTSDIQTLLDGTIGDFKNHVAVLLMLNQPAMTQYIEVPRTRGWIGHKPKPYMAHRTVRVTMDPVDVVRKLSHGGGEGSGAVRRRHRVRGHYCHSARARAAVCDHAWIAVGADWEPVAVKVGDDPERWACNRCQGRRWWREAHTRGDAGIGWIDHDYRVEA